MQKSDRCLIDADLILIDVDLMVFAICGVSISLLGSTLWYRRPVIYSFDDSYVISTHHLKENK